jgi:hypothetical protein
VFHPAWSDQRISTGDVRTPGTNTYTAGTGPNAVTTGISYSASGSCPPDTLAVPESSVVRWFVINNTGNVPDKYSYTISDNAGWIGGPLNGSVGPVLAGGSGSIAVKVNVSANCTPPADVITLSFTPVGEGCLSSQVCQTQVNCDAATPTLVANFVASQAREGVTLTWFSDAVDQVRGWNIYRSAEAEGGYVLLNAGPIAMSSGGVFHFVDDPPLAGTAYYRLAAVHPDGTESTVAITQVGTPASFSFGLAGTNPVMGGTSLRYSLPAAGHVRIEVFGVSGQRVRTLVDRTESAGGHTVEFSLRNGSERALPPGIYMVRISAGKDQKLLRVVALE